jgi:23S rRNA G2445 N2-methylase RlmL
VNALSAIRAVNRAIKADVQGTHLMNSTTTDFLTAEQWQRVIAYSEQSLQSADATDEETLNKLYPEFGTRLKRDFVEGQRLRISGLKNKSKGDFAKSQKLNGAWRDWYDTNQKQIEEAFNAALQ